MILHSKGLLPLNKYTNKVPSMCVAKRPLCHSAGPLPLLTTVRNEEGPVKGRALNVHQIESAESWKFTASPNMLRERENFV